MNAKSLKNSILQWAIEGKLVTQDPNEEPAIELLKRINPNIKPITENTPFDIPESWVWCRLGEIVKLNPKNESSDDTLSAFIPMEKIGATYGSQYTYDEVKWGTIKKAFTHFADGDVAIAKITPCFQNRKSVIFKDLPNGIGAGTTELKVLRPYGETISRWYLLYFLKSSYFVEEATFKGTANQQRIVKGYLEEKLFPLPPLAEQERIVAKLEELLPLVESYGKAQEGLDKLNGEIKGKLRASVLQEAIAGRLVAQDPNDEPATELLKRIDPSFTPPEYDEPLPQGWCACQLKDCGVNVLNGYAFKSSEYSSKGVRVIRIMNVQDGKIVDNEPKFYPLDNEEIKKYYLREGDLLMSLTGNVGRVGWMPTSLLPAALNQRVACLRFQNISISKQYLFYFLQSDLFRKDCINSGKGIAQLNISTEWLKQYKFPLPPLAEQERIVEKIEELLAVLDNL